MTPRPKIVKQATNQNKKPASIKTTAKHAKVLGKLGGRPRGS